MTNNHSIYLIKICVEKSQKQTYASMVLIGDISSDSAASQTFSEMKMTCFLSLDAFMKVDRTIGRLIAGPIALGSSFLIDPNGPNAWNAAIFLVVKKWIMFPPPPLLHPVSILLMMAETLQPLPPQVVS